MGLIKAAFDGARKTLADQWLEYFYCDTLDNDVLLKKGSKVVNTGSNTKGSENIITNGTGFAINEGQGLIIVEDGKIVEFSVEPGRFTWDSSSEPSLFDSGFHGLKESFKVFGQRFKAGGTEAKDQRVYYINIKEILDNKFGSATPMAYKDPTYRGIYIRYFGQYSFKIADPIRFYSNIAGNVRDVYTKEELMRQCQAEFVNALDTTLAKCSDEGYQYNDLPKKQMEIATFMNDALDVSWHEKRGLEVESVAIEKVTPDDESRMRIEKIDDAIMMSDQRVAAGRLVGAQATAMENAAANDAGAMQGFLGMGFAAQAGGMNTGQMFAGAQPQENNPLFTQSQPTTDWTCACGAHNSGKFCSECGKPKPEAEWTCECGAKNKGKFCSECGKSKPE
ncbi:MAG: SPFH domain-containing protein [Bacilli bacterium]|nr:SPFH domain-containing protein [Bacilli bacterium]